MEEEKLDAVISQGSAQAGRILFKGAENRRVYFCLRRDDSLPNRHSRLPMQKQYNSSTLEANIRRIGACIWYFYRQWSERTLAGHGHGVLWLITCGHTIKLTRGFGVRVFRPIKNTLMSFRVDQNLTSRQEKYCDAKWRTNEIIINIVKFWLDNKKVNLVEWLLKRFAFLCIFLILCICALHIEHLESQNIASHIPLRIFILAHYGLK